MKTLHKTIYYSSRSDTFRLYHLTDVHLGHRACDEALLKATVQEIQDDDHAYWGGGGDMADFIPRVGDKRFRESSIAPWLHGENDIATCEIERVIEYLSPIAHKCLYFLKGNHEDTLLQYYGTDAYKRMVKGIALAGGQEVSQIALGWEGFVQLTFRRGKPSSYGGSWRMTLYTHHGAGGGRKAGAHALRLEELLTTYDADLIFYGHRHVHQSLAKQTVYPYGNSAVIRSRLGIMCPSLLHAYLPDDGDGIPVDNYPQRTNLPPTEVGVAKVGIKPDIRWILPLTEIKSTGEVLA